jgi:tetratricopeptide (TPR) repeat protein
VPLRILLVSLALFWPQLVSADSARQRIETLAKGGDGTRSELIKLLLDRAAGEAARREAAAWTDRAPASVIAWLVQADVLQRDVFGRWQRSGFDREGAESALRRALTLEPDNRAALHDLALLASQRRATRGEAIVALLRLRGAGVRSDDELLTRLMLVEGRARELLAQKDLAPELRLAAQVRRTGPDLALLRLQKSMPSTEPRRVVVRAAAAQLLRARFYAEASRLFLASLPAGEGQEALRGTYAGMALIGRHETIAYTDDKTATPVLHLIEFAFGLEGAPPPSGLVSERMKPDEVARALRDIRSQLLDETAPTADAAFDLLLARRNIASEGTETDGYRVRLLAPRSMGFHVIREAGTYRVLSVDADAAQLKEADEATRNALTAIDSSRPDRAREQILRAVDLHGGPIASDWYVLGRLFEDDGLTSDAQAAYARAAQDPRLAALVAERLQGLKTSPPQP